MGFCVYTGNDYQILIFRFRIHPGRAGDDAAAKNGTRIHNNLLKYNIILHFRLRLTRLMIRPKQMKSVSRRRTVMIRPRGVL